MYIDKVYKDLLAEFKDDLDIYSSFDKTIDGIEYICENITDPSMHIEELSTSIARYLKDSPLNNNGIYTYIHDEVVVDNIWSIETSNNQGACGLSIISIPRDIDI